MWQIIIRQIIIRQIIYVSQIIFNTFRQIKYYVYKLKTVEHKLKTRHKLLLFSPLWRTRARELKIRLRMQWNLPITMVDSEVVYDKAGDEKLQI